MNSEYAYSLFMLGKEENILDIFYSDIKKLLDVFKEEDVIDFLENKFINIKNKKETLCKLLKDVDVYIGNFINVIIDDNKEDCLVDIFKEFIKLYYKEKNIIEGIVYGIEEKKEELEKLEKVFEKKLNKRVILTFKKDDSLIGGFKVIVDNKLYDNSYKTKLNNLKEKLLKEGEEND